MIIDNTQINMNSPAREIDARVELIYNRSTFAGSFNKDDYLKSFTVERVGEEGKFFGFGVCTKLKVNVLDREREFEITNNYSLKPILSAGGNYISPYPDLYVTEVSRNENTNEITITAYDDIYKAAEHTFDELALPASYSIFDVVEGIVLVMELHGVKFIGVTEEENPFDTVYPNGGNFEGTETFRETLNAIAEATQTIYYMDSENDLVFRRLDKDAAPDLEIGKADYFTLETKEMQTITGVVSATALGDNVGTGLESEGAIQYVRDNPFWDIQENVDELVEKALAAIGGLSITQFDCKWRGNFLLEPGDKISLTTKDDNAVISFVLNDSLEFKGGLSAKTSWGYGKQEKEHVNPSTLGDVLKQTYAKVDKVNKEVEIVVDEAASLKMTTEGITSSVSKMDGSISDLTYTVNTKMSADQVNLSIENALGEGVDKVTTATGFTFNSEGLNVSKSDSQMKTTITEDGMAIYKNNEEVLKADNSGVKAEDLHATTFLIVGTNSRFENYGSSRTGCFWIGN